ncbi:hypothetical protein ACFXJ5_09875 [Streptomyces sp. NPDC059373]
MFNELAGNGFRRVAATTWTSGSYRSWTSTEIQLIQFRDDKQTFAVDMLSEQQDYMSEKKYAGNHGKEIPGSVDGYAWVYSKPDTKAGYLPEYTARALVRHGNIVIDIWYYTARPISMKTIQSLAKRQLERL